MQRLQLEKFSLMTPLSPEFLFFHKFHLLISGQSILSLARYFTFLGNTVWWGDFVMLFHHITTTYLHPYVMPSECECGGELRAKTGRELGKSFFFLFLNFDSLHWVQKGACLTLRNVAANGGTKARASILEVGGETTLRGIGASTPELEENYVKPALRDLGVWKDPEVTSTTPTAGESQGEQQGETEAEENDDDDDD